MGAGVANGEGQAPVLDGKLTIVMVGAFWDGSTSLHRRTAMEALGHHVIPIDVQPETSPNRSALLARARSRLFRLGLNSFSPRDRVGTNKRLLDSAKHCPDLVWLDKALTVEASTLTSLKRELPECLVVGYSPDDMSARFSQSRQFLEHLPLYDVFFTTKRWRIEALELTGCRRVHYVADSFDTDTHRPWQIDDDERRLRGGAVGFIGRHETARAQAICALGAAGIPVRVWGPNWFKLRRPGPNVRLERRAVWGPEYARTICAFDINLVFLSVLAGDRQTTRSVEVPACGAFMLAERTAEHLALFDEGKEAEFFGSTEELIRKVRYYLANPKARQRIAAAGRARCLSSGYSNRHRVAEMLAVAQAFITGTT